MSILIKGMEMPNRGHTTTITIVGSGQAYVEYFDCRPHVEETIEYTAVPVPPHGRLIDADALIEDLERQCKAVFRIDAVSPDDYWITRNEAYNEALWKTWVESFGKYLKTRLTIIPAEESER